MTTLVSDDQVRSHFSMTQCVTAVEAAFRAAGKEPFDVTERKVVAVDGAARLLSLTAASSEFGRLVANIYSGAPSGADKRTSSVNRRQKLYVLFDAATGACEAIVSGARLAWLKTGAMGAVAIKHLSNPDSRRLGIIGSGRQARAALLGAAAVREFDQVSVWSPTPGNAARMVEDMTDIPGIGVAGTPRAAVDGADVVITVTTSTVPVLSSEWIKDGCHINAIGAHYPNSREIDGAVVGRSTVVVDTMVAARAEKGELLIAEQEGYFSFDDVAGELGEIVAGTVPFNRSEDDTTLFASSGSAIESMGAAVGAFEAIPPGERHTFEF